jgi:gamma-glutamyltranspeptidase
MPSTRRSRCRRHCRWWSRSVPGIGGGGFFLLHQAATNRDVFVDARETAPAAATPAAFLDKDGELDRDRAENGPWSAGIPGLPAGLVHVARNYGRLPLKTSLRPAIRLARDGFPVYARLEEGYAERREVMQRYPGTRAVFLADGDAPTVKAKPSASRTWPAHSKHSRAKVSTASIAARWRRA